MTSNINTIIVVQGTCSSLATSSAVHQMQIVTVQSHQQPKSLPQTGSDRKENPAIPGYVQLRRIWSHWVLSYRLHGRRQTIGKPGDHGKVLRERKRRQPTTIKLSSCLEQIYLTDFCWPHLWLMYPILSQCGYNPKIFLLAPLAELFCIRTALSKRCRRIYDCNGWLNMLNSNSTIPPSLLNFGGAHAWLRQQ